MNNMRNKILSLLVLLLTTATGTWAQQVQLEVTEITVPESWKDDNTPLTTDDMPGFIPMYKEEVRTWDNIPPTGTHIVIREIRAGGNCESVYFKDGAFYMNGGITVKHKNIYDNIQTWGYTYYYTGSPKNLGTPVTIGWNAGTKIATIDAMPAGNVTAYVKYYSRASVKLAITGDGGTASLMDKTFKPLTETDKIDEGDRFVLKLLMDDECGFNVGLKDLLLEEFSTADYQAYLAYARENNIEVPANTTLMWVTMPDTNDKDLTVPVTFQQEKTFTVLYQPSGGSPTDVWCRIGIRENNQDYFSYGRMMCNSKVGDAVVWSMSVQSAFNPKQVAFFTSKEAAEDDAAAMNDAVVSQTTNNWTSVDGGKYIIIGGNAKALIAAFVTDPSAAPVYNSETASYDYDSSKTGATYQIVACTTDDGGNVTSPASVTVPANPAAPVGKEFVTWAALNGEAPNKTEQTYTAGQVVNIRENMTISAVWKPTKVTVKLDLNGGTGIETTASVDYGTKLNVANPTQKGFAFNGWTLDEDVVEGLMRFPKGSKFDTNRGITADLSLKAQWKHAHTYACYPLSRFSDSMADYQKYVDVNHIAVCACGDIRMMAHEYDTNGKCACQNPNPAESDAVLFEKSYVQLSNGNYTVLSPGIPSAGKKNNIFSCSAPSRWGNLEFLKWQCSTDDGATWGDVTADLYTQFTVSCNLKVRAVYFNNSVAQVNLSAYHFDDEAVQNGQTYIMDNVLFYMNYKLPYGFTFVDAGVTMGDNEGISYYKQYDRKYKQTTTAKMMSVGVLAAASIIGGEPTTASLSATEKCWTKREDNALDEMSAETLAKFMYEGKPVNWEVETFYWVGRSPTKGLTGSVGTTPPLRFIQRNNGNHYVYGIGWLEFKKPGSDKTEVIYTDALPATRDNIPSYTVSKTSQPAGARMMAPASSMARGAMRAPEQNMVNENFDMRSVSAPETELNVFVDGGFAADLSDRYGFGDMVTLTAPAVNGKTFKYWEADGKPVSSSSELNLTMNAHTTLRAVYGNGASDVPTAGFTSVTRTADGTQISFQAIADASATEAGIIYSTTATGDALKIDGTGVTKVAAVSTEALASATTMPESVLDDNNNWMLLITPESADAVYHARVYATIGGSTVYSDVKDVKLANLKNGISGISRLGGFEHDLDDALKALKLSGEAKPMACFLIDETEPAAVEGITAGEQQPIVTVGQTTTGTVMYAIGQSATETPALTDFSAEVPNAAAFTGDYTEDLNFYVYYYIKGADGYVDSEIFAPLAVTLKKNQYSLTLKPAPVDKATVTIDGTAATADELQTGKIDAVKVGNEVKLKAKEGYKFRKVVVKEKEPSPFTKVTDADKGKLICTDGHIHAYGEDAECTADRVAIIVYVGATGNATYNHGLALAMSDVSGGTYTWSTTYNNAHTYQTENSGDFSSTVEDGLQYNAIQNNATYPAFQAAISNNGTAVPEYCSAWFLPSGYQWELMINAAGGFATLRDGFSGVGGTDLQSTIYYSSTERGMYSAWYYSFFDGVWYWDGKVDVRVRSAIAF